ncbi:MAG: GNAT family N-acetyltransferase [Bacteroidetes bacterium]|nr:GNAT family N-acetyltransferase [Bacteroidota bacterium]
MPAILIRSAAEKELPVIERLARSFDLDWENVSWKQFLVAMKGNRIIGFGRLRSYEKFSEVATVGVIPEERNKGIGSSIVKELLRLEPKEIFVTCVIPHFFERLGFTPVKQYPPVLQKKVDFCKCYNFSEEEIFVMRKIK